MTINYRVFYSFRSASADPARGSGDIAATPMILAGPTGRGPYRRFFKRAFDITAIVLAAPAVDKTIAVFTDPTALTLIGLLQTYDGQPKPVSTIGGSGTPVITYKAGSTTSTTPPTNAGSYVVSAQIGTGPSAVVKAGTLVIAKAPLLFIADNQRRLINYSNLFLNYRIEGLVGGNTQITGLKWLGFSTAANENSPGGSYPIVGKGGTADNYLIIERAGTLVVATSRICSRLSTEHGPAII